MNLRYIQAQHSAWVKRQGWREKAPLESLMLIVTEVSEAAEELRQPVVDRRKFAYELADIVLRVAAFAESEGISLEEAVLQKMSVNAARDKSEKTV